MNDGADLRVGLRVQQPVLGKRKPGELQAGSSSMLGGEGGPQAEAIAGVGDGSDIVASPPTSHSPDGVLPAHPKNVF